MAYARSMLVALIAFLWAFVMTKAKGTGRPAGWMLIRMQHEADELLGRLGSTRLATWLLGLPAWRRLSLEILNRMPEDALHLTIQGACALAVIGAAAFVAILGLLSASPLGLLVGLAAVAVGVPVWASARAHADHDALVAEMPGVFRTLSTALGSGQTLSQAIEYVGAHEEGLAGQAFSRVGMRMRCGESCEEALGHLAEELDAPGVDLLTTALVISQRTGSPLKALFQSSAALVERQGDFERSLSVKTAQVRLSVRIVCLLPAILVGALSIISPDFRSGLATLPGMGSIILALFMDAAALLIIHQLLKGVV